MRSDKVRMVSWDCDTGTSGDVEENGAYKGSVPVSTPAQNARL